MPRREGAAEINWLVADQLGTPRMIIDKTGSLATTKRYDYLPFGEELVANQGLRTTGLGYTGDTIRQKFTLKERDNETGLDYFLARYYSSTQGRFTSADAPFADQSPDDPQSWNLYTYVRNNPLRSIDPDGRKMDVDFIEKVRNLSAGYGFQTDAEVKAETFRRLCEIRHFTDSTTTPTMVHLANPNTGEELYLAVKGLSRRQIWDISNMIRSGQVRIEENFDVPEVAAPINISPKQLNKKFKHAEDFGVKGNYNKANAAKYQKAIEDHVDDPAVREIQGTYRGQPVTHYVNPKTGIDVMKTTSGD